MKRKIVIITAFLLVFAGGFTSCEKEINEKLIGKWVNENTKDTLSFLTTSIVHYNPFYLNDAVSPNFRCQEYYIEGNTITFCYRSNSNSIFEFLCSSCSFEYSKKQLKLYRNFNNDIYKRIK